MASGSKLIVSGNSAALVRAAEQIGAQAVPDAAAEEAAQGEAGASGRDSEGAEGSSLGGGNLAKSNELATPPNLPVTASPGTVETIVNNDVFGTTTEGCEPQLDEATGEVVIFEAPTKNGTVTGDCAQSLRRLPVKNSFAGCLYQIDTEALVAKAQSRRFFTNGPDTTFLDENCVPDPEVQFQISESEVGCPLVPNLGALKAKQHTKLTFLGRENETVTAGDCAARTGAEFAIAFDRSACPMRDDFEAGRTVVQHRAVYTGGDGIERAVTGCLDTEEFFTHTKDTSVCEPFPDFVNNKLFPQFRIRIPLSGPDAFRTPSCQPDTASIADLVATGEGCEAYHEDFDGFSLGGKRIVRSDTNEQVRACEASDVQYPHQREAQGFLNDDAGLSATPKEALFIVLPQPAGKTFIEQAVVRADAVAVPYTLNRTFIRNDEVTYVDGACEKFQNRSNIKVWNRPDGTEFEQVASEAPALGPLPACAAPTLHEISSSSSSSCGCGGKGNVNFQRRFVREDGFVLIDSFSTLQCNVCPEETF